MRPALIHAAGFEEPRTLQEHLHTTPRGVRTVLAMLSAAALIGLLAASGCINGESVDSSPQDSAAAAAPARKHRAAIPVAGDVLIAGGVDDANQSIAAAEFFDPSSGQFVATGSAASSRAGASAAPLSPTQVLFAGGFSGIATIKNFSLDLEGKVLSSAESFDETTGTFSPAGTMATPRMGFTATALNHGKVLIAGGVDDRDDVLETAELYDPATRKFAAVANPMSDRGAFQTATLLLSGKVLIAGGATNLTGDTTNSADIYDPGSNSFTPATLPMDHHGAPNTATLL